MSTCPTCHGTGEVAGAVSVDFLPGLAEALQAHQAGRGLANDQRAGRCSVCIVINHAVPGESKNALISAAAGRISGKALRRSLRALGINLSEGSIYNHRNEAHQP